MLLTDRFTKVIKYFFAFACLMFVYTLFLSISDLLGYSQSDDSLLREILNFTKSFLSILGFAVALGYLTREWRGTIVIAGFQLGFLGYMIYSYGMLPDPEIGYGKSYLYSHVGNLISIAVFGILYFKSLKGLWFILFWIIFYGIDIGMIPYFYIEHLESFGRFFGLRDFLSFRISIDSRSSRGILILPIFIRGLYPIVKLIVVWWLLCKIKNIKEIGFSLNSICYPKKLGIISFSIIFWSCQFVLFSSAHGILHYLEYNSRQAISFETIARIISYCLGLIVVASIYRNFLVSQFASQHLYPNYLFILLHIPFLNVIVWILIVIFSSNSNLAYSESDKLLVEKLKTTFIRRRKNVGIKILVVVISLFSLLFQLNSAGFRIDGPSQEGAFTLLVLGLIMLVLLIWFLSHESGYYVLILFFSVQILLVIILKNDTLLHPTLATSLLNVLLYYGLFHFHQFKWVNCEFENAENITELGSS